MDLSTFFDEVAATVALPKPEEFPALPVSEDGHGNGQVSEYNDISRISRISRSPEEGSGFFEHEAAQAGASAGGRAGARGAVSEPREMREQREMPAGSSSYISRSLSKKREIEKETGNPPDLRALLTLASDPDRQLAFDERAAFLEYECGLSRAEAEAQAASDILPNLPAEPQIVSGQRACAPAGAGPLLRSWHAGLAALSPSQTPCPDYRGDEWPRVYKNALAFLDTFGAQTEALGWQTHELFGVHPDVGTARPDHCGALVLTSGGTVRAITADTIRLDRATYRRVSGQPQGVPIWKVGR